MIMYISYNGCVYLINRITNLHLIYCTDRENVSCTQKPSGSGTRRQNYFHSKPPENKAQYCHWLPVFCVQFNIQVKGHLVQKLLSGHKDRQTRTGPIALPGPLEWLGSNQYLYTCTMRLRQRMIRFMSLEVCYF